MARALRQAECLYPPATAGRMVRVRRGLGGRDHGAVRPPGDFHDDYPYREIVVAGTPWCYRTGGVRDGPALLLLAGGTVVPDPFFLVIETLGRRYRIIAPAYPPIWTMAGLVTGVTAILDVEQVRTAHVVGSSFGGYLAQCFVRAHPERVDTLILTQTGVRHFVGARPVTVLRWLLQMAPAGVVRWIMWRTWRVLIADIGPDRRFWTGLLRGILDTELSKAHLVAVTAAIADFPPTTGRRRVGCPGGTGRCWCCSPNTTGPSPPRPTRSARRIPRPNPA